MMLLVLRWESVCECESSTVWAPHVRKCLDLTYFIKKQPFIFNTESFKCRSLTFVFLNKKDKQNLMNTKKASQINSGVLVTGDLHFSDHCFQQHIFIFTAHTHRDYTKTFIYQTNTQRYIYPCMWNTHKIYTYLCSGIYKHVTLWLDEGRGTLTGHSRTFTHLEIRRNQTIGRFDMGLINFPVGQSRYVSAQHLNQSLNTSLSDI